MYYRQYELPWTLPAEDVERFRRILRAVLGAAVVLGLLIPWLPLPEREPIIVPDVPPRLARLMMEQRVQPPPPPPPKPEPLPTEQRPPPRIFKEQPAQPPIDRRQQARQKASVAGLLPFVDDLAALRDNAALASLDNDGPLSGAPGDGRRVERALIAAKAGRGSGGINTAGLSRDTGGTGLGPRGTTRVTSTMGALAAEAATPSGLGGKPSRSREEIEMVFDQNKGAIYALYSRALRKDPTLQGKLVLQLTIEPSGAVSSCEVISSELDDEDLLQKLVQRVKMFRFVEKDVATVTTTKPIDFFPA